MNQAQHGQGALQDAFRMIAQAAQNGETQYFSFTDGNGNACTVAIAFGDAALDVQSTLQNYTAPPQDNYLDYLNSSAQATLGPENFARTYQQDPYEYSDPTPQQNDGDVIDATYSYPVATHQGHYQQSPPQQQQRLNGGFGRFRRLLPG